MRAASAVVVAVGLGVALSVILTSSGLRASVVPGVLGFAALIAACVYLGWLVAQFTSAAVGLAAAPVVVLGMIGVLLGVKLIRMPFAPLVGDAFEILRSHLCGRRRVRRCSRPSATAAESRGSRGANGTLAYRSGAGAQRHDTRVDAMTGA